MHAIHQLPGASDAEAIALAEELERLHEAALLTYPGEEFGHSSSDTYLNASPAHRRAVAELQATLLVAAARYPNDFWTWLVELSPEIDAFNSGFVLGEIRDELNGLGKCAGVLPNRYIRERIATLQELRVQLIVGILEALILSRVSSPTMSFPWLMNVTGVLSQELKSYLNPQIDWSHHG